MPKARVYELAKQFGVDSKTVLEKLKDMGEFVKSSSSTVEAPVVRRLKSAFAADSSSASSKPSPSAQHSQNQGASQGGSAQSHASKPGNSAHPKAPAPKPGANRAIAEQSRPAQESAHAEAPKPGMPHPGPKAGQGHRQGPGKSHGSALSKQEEAIRQGLQSSDPRIQDAARRMQRELEEKKANGESRRDGATRPTGSRPGPRADRGERTERGDRRNAPKPGASPRPRNASGDKAPRPGNNPFTSHQGMHVPTPNDIPRPHPMARPTVNGPHGRNGRPAARNGRPGQGGAGGRWGHSRAGQGAGASGARHFGAGAPHTDNGPAGRGGHGAPGGRPGRGRGGAAGAFGHQGGRSSKARKNARRAKQQEYEEMKAPVIGGVRIPSGHGQTIRLRQGASLADLAEKINVSPASLVTVLFHLGEMATATQSLNEDTFQILGDEIGWNIKIVSSEEEDKELLQQFDINLDDEQDMDDEDLVPRPPVVTVMGHVDHGKTRLLDTIRKTNVSLKEAGGITQRIGAYQVSVHLNGEERKITFLDTPGHEAFTAMRARGAELTDVAILVVAADDGVMPQTVEAINHAQAANVPIVVAVNKIDVPGANPEKVRGQLTEFGLVPEEYGGDTMFVDISAKKNINIDKLLEAVLLTADATLDLRANPNMPARGATVEARLDKGRGAVATVLVQQGTLHVGDAIVAGTSYGRVRAMLDENGNSLTEALPSRPVSVLGLTSVPTAGDLFLVAPDDRAARQIAEKRAASERAAQLAKRRKVVSLEEFKEQFAKSEIDMLNVVIKGDSSGSVEALEDSLMKIEVSDEVGIQVIHRGVGAITQNDVNLASVDKAVIIGFNVRPNRQVADLAEHEGVEIKYYSVIYKAIEDVEAALKGMLKPEFEEVVTSHSEIREIFRSSKFGNIAGVMVQDGTVKRGTKCRIMRNGVVTINDLEISSLRRFKDDVNEVEEGYECGINLGDFNDIQIGDVIETFEMREVERK